MPTHCDRPILRYAALPLLLAVAAPGLAAIKSWNAGSGAWTTAGNWSPAGVPGSSDTVRIGNLAGVQDTVVNAANAPFVPDQIEISDGMTLDTGGTEFVGFDLLVTISGGDSRMIVRPHAGINQYDFIGELQINPGSVLELTNNVPMRLFWDSFNWGRIEGWGEIQVNSPTPFNNNGVINPGNNSLRFEQTWSNALGAFDLDGGLDFGQVWLDVPFSILEINASALADPFDGVINMDPGTLLTMNVEDGWEIDSGGVLNASGGIANAAAQINGDDLTFAGSMTVNNEGILRVLADATIDPGAIVWGFADSRLELDGTTTVNGGAFWMNSGSRVDFDGPTTMRGGEFNTPSTDPADGVVNFNAPSTTWNGSVGAIEINGIARQMGNAFVGGQTVINADTFDMDGDGDTLWTIWNDLTINADMTQPGVVDDTFTGTMNIASTAGKLTVNIEPANADFHMNGEMNLIGHPAVYHTRYAGDTLQLHGELNASGKVAVAAHVWAYEGTLTVADANATLRLDGGSIIGLDCAISGDGEIRVGPGAPLSALFPHANFGGVGLVSDGRMGVPGGADVDRFQQTGSGIWKVYLRGYDAGDNDQLRVTGGDAALDGLLEVDFFMFEPIVGDEFTILRAIGNVSGTFDANPSNCEDGNVYQWTVLYGPHDVTLHLDAIGLKPGDMNCDCRIDFFDIDPFVLAIFDPAAYEATHPDCSVMHADVNGDGLLNFFDIDPFVAVLFP